MMTDYTNYQIPPGLVVKFQTVDIFEVIELSWSAEAHPVSVNSGYPLKAGHCYTTMVSGL
jgi:hypothetical protein